MRSSGPVRYGEGYKYQLREDWWVDTGIKGCAARIVDGYDPFRPWISLDQDGRLTVKEGYAWDGCSGPTWDDKTNMRGSLAHDALYQLMRAGKLGVDMRESADRVLRDLCLKDGMSRVRAWAYYHAVRLFAGFAAKRRTMNAEVAPKEYVEA